MHAWALKLLYKGVYLFLRLMQTGECIGEPLLVSEGQVQHSPGHLLSAKDQVSCAESFRGSSHLFKVRLSFAHPQAIAFWCVINAIRLKESVICKLFR